MYYKFTICISCDTIQKIAYNIANSITSKVKLRKTLRIYKIKIM